MLHRHKWDIISATDETKEYQTMVGPSGYRSVNMTSTVERCSRCKKVRGNDYFGHHAAQLKQTILQKEES